MKRAALLLLALCACAGMGRRRAVETADILDRQETAPQSEVKHVLVAWSWLEPRYRQMGMALDPRAQARNESQADEIATDVLQRCRAGESFEPMMAKLSEDPGSARGGTSYTVTKDARMAPGFVELALRLKPGECGVVRTDFGDHVIKRIR